MENQANYLSVVENTSKESLTAAEIKSQVNLIQSVMASVMKPKTHYMIIPGTNENSLLKAGAEKILSTFRIACVPEVEDKSTSDAIRYLVRVKGVHQTTGTIMGVGVGECSSDEEKYKWRSVICEAEWDATPEDKRRIKFVRGYQNQPARQVQQIRTSPADLANTVLKMAKKRAMVDMTLTATAASDVFVQDLEDMPEELIKPAGETPCATPKAKAQPAAKPQQSGASATEGQCRLLRVKLKQNDKDESGLCKQFGLKALEDLNKDKVNDAIAWITQQ